MMDTWGQDMQPEDIETQILLYSTLPLEEQQAVERYVAQHPELEPQLKQARQLGDLLASARLLEAEPEHDEVLACLCLTRDLEPLPPALQRARDRLEERLEDDPALRARCEELERRAARLTAQSDARAQFEALTGRSLADDEPEEPAGETEKTARADRAPMRRGARWKRRARSVLAAALVMGLLYGVLYLAGPVMMQSSAERLATLESDEMVVEGFGLRTRSGEASGAQKNASADQRYLQALGHLREAPAATFGLFPRYDSAALRQAETLLEEVIDAEASGSFLQLEAYYWLGQARLALDDADGATEALRTVVAGEGRRAAEAYQQLATLHADAAYE